MPLALTGLATFDHLQESGLKSKWEVWREYAYKASLAVVSLFVLAPQVNFNCVDYPYVNKSSLTTPQAHAVNSYCKTHYMPNHTRYSTLVAFLESIGLYFVSNFWIYLYGNKQRLHNLGKLRTSILELHMGQEELKEVIVQPLTDSSDERSKAVRENRKILLNWGSSNTLWNSYVSRCVVLMISLICCIVLSCSWGDSLSIFHHGQNDIVICYIPKYELGHEIGKLKFACVDEFTMIDSMLEFIYFCCLIAQFVFVFIASCQLIAICIERKPDSSCFGSKCQNCVERCRKGLKSLLGYCLKQQCDTLYFLIPMADMDDDHSSKMIKDFCECVGNEEALKKKKHARACCCYCEFLEATEQEASDGSGGQSRSRLCCPPAFRYQKVSQEESSV